jgi:Na+-transporting methylmalonyl-CoA/oxaloacetate decarboxylase gamma subunit
MASWTPEQVFIIGFSMVFLVLIILAAATWVICRVLQWMDKKLAKSESSSQDRSVR